MNSSPGTTSVRRIWISSSAGGVIVKAMSATNGPPMVIFSMPSFHWGHAAISDHGRQTSSGAAMVSTPCLCLLPHASFGGFTYTKTRRAHAPDAWSARIVLTLEAGEQLRELVGAADHFLRPARP